MLSKKRPHHPKADGPDRHYHVPTYGARYFAEPVPKFELPEHAMPADAAYQICHDELNLDGNPALNLASFVTTWMEPEAERLIVESLNKNYVDQDEYPRTTVIQERCVNMLARLYHAPHDAEAVGTGTVGSSEAIMLAGLAAKWRWHRRRAAAGKPTDRPNLVMASTVQVVWEKFARYFDVEPRYVPVTADRTTLAPDEAIRFIDENTIAVVAILGSTYTGEYEPIAAIHDAVAEVNDRNGWEVPIHVDAASGGFVAPFLEPDLNWDFRLPLVKSINVSGHKYGLVYPGIGWVVWRDRADLPEDLIFHISYLGGDEATFNLNFSKGAASLPPLPAHSPRIIYHQAPQSHHQASFTTHTSASQHFHVSISCRSFQQPDDRSLPPAFDSVTGSFYQPPASATPSVSQPPLPSSASRTSFPHSLGTSSDRPARSSPSITTSCGWAGRATAGS